MAELEPFMETKVASMPKALSASVGMNNTNNFSASEIQRQSKKLEEEKAVLLFQLQSAKNICDDISRVVRSEDSRLSDNWKALGDTFAGLKGKYEKALETMVDRMKTYAKKTLETEEEMAKSTTEVDSELDEISSFLESIDL